MDDSESFMQTGFRHMLQIKFQDVKYLFRHDFCFAGLWQICHSLSQSSGRQTGVFDLRGWKYRLVWGFQP